LKTRGIFLIVIVVSGLFCGGCDQPALEDIERRPQQKTVFPGVVWDRARPEEHGFSQTALDSIAELMERNKSNGVLVRNGYLIGEWLFGGEANKKFDTSR
jgi:hypothetical protein